MPESGRSSATNKAGVGEKGRDAPSAGRIDHRLCDIVPSDDLRKRFRAKPDEWPAFRVAYARDWSRTRRAKPLFS